MKIPRFISHAEPVLNGVLEKLGLPYGLKMDEHDRKQVCPNFTIMQKQ